MKDLQQRMEVLTESQVRVLMHLFLAQADGEQKKDTATATFYRDLAAVLLTRLDKIMAVEPTALMHEGEPLPDTLEGVRWPSALAEAAHEAKLFAAMGGKRWAGPDHAVALFYLGIAHQLQIRERMAKKDVEELRYMELGVRRPKVYWEGPDAA